MPCQALPEPAKRLLQGMRMVFESRAASSDDANGDTADGGAGEREAEDWARPQIGVGGETNGNGSNGNGGEEPSAPPLDA